MHMGPVQMPPFAGRTMLGMGRKRPAPFIPPSRADYTESSASFILMEAI